MADLIHLRSGELCRWWYDRCPYAPIFLPLFKYCLVLLPSLLDWGFLMSPYSIYDLFERIGSLPRFYGEMQKNVASRNSFGKEARAAEEAAAWNEKARRRSAVLPTPLSMEGHPVDPETERCWRGRAVYRALPRSRNCRTSNTRDDSPIPRSIEQPSVKSLEAKIFQ